MMRVFPVLIVLFELACGQPVVLQPDDGETDTQDAGGASTGDGGSADGGVFDAGPPPSPDELALAVCTALQRGRIIDAQLRAAAVAPAQCAPDDLLPIGDPILQSTDCTQVDPLFRAVRDAIVAGNVEVDLAALARCEATGTNIAANLDTQAEFGERLAAVAALSDDVDCAEAVVGKVAPGDPCAGTIECTQGLLCEADPLDSAERRCLDPALEGQRCDVVVRGESLPLRTCDDGLVCVLRLCTRPVLLGGTCAGDVPCAQGLFCNAELTCEEVPPIEVTPALDDGQACETDAGRLECAGRCSVCKPTLDVRRCGPPGGTGELCDDDTHCRRELRCNAGACAARLAAGAPCTPNACESQLTCADEVDAGPHCVPRAALDESCATVPCAAALFCEADQCREGVANDPCSGDASCTTGHFCVDGTCVVEPRAGAPCTTDGRCEAGLLCNAQNRCVELPTPGSACANGVCDDDGHCVDDLCVQKGAAGDACQADDQCISALCLDTLTCSAPPASCLSGRDTFAQLLGLSLILSIPLLRRRRR